MYFIKFETKNEFGQTEIATYENIMESALKSMIEIISRRFAIVFIEKQT